MYSSVIPSDYLQLLEAIGDRFQHCISVSAIDLPDQPLVYVNARFESDTGYSRAEILGHNCRFLQGDMREQPARAKMSTSISEGRATFNDLINFRRDGSPFINRLVLLPFDYISTPDTRYYIGVQRVMGDPSDHEISTFEPKNGEIENTINNPLSIALGFAEIGETNIGAVDDAISRIEAYVDSL